MTRFRFSVTMTASLVLTVALASVGSAQNSRPRRTPAKSAEVAADKNEVICKIYPLAEISNDPHLGQWIADTIPALILPGSWSPLTPPPAQPSPGPLHSYYFNPVQADGTQRTPPVASANKRTLSYYAPAKVLVVNHTLAVHAQIDTFLQNLKSALPANAAGKSATTSGVAQAHHLVPNPQRAPDGTPSSKSTAYPVPAPQQQPKHLFHFIIRYEGDGAVDGNVTSLLRSYQSTTAGGDDRDIKTRAEAPTSTPLSQLFNFIIRYEGDGLIDANVVEFMKSYQAAERKAADMERRGDPLVPVPNIAPAVSGSTEVPPPPPFPGGSNPFSFVRPMSLPMAPGAGIPLMPKADDPAPPTSVPASVPALPPVPVSPIIVR